MSPNTVDDDRRESEDDSDDDNGGMDYNHGQYRDPIDDEKLERELEARRRALIRYDHQRQQLIFLGSGFSVESWTLPFLPHNKVAVKCPST